ncbi:MAG: PGPGW domain-containing protein [Thermoguttaceae bacterium]
MIEWVQTHETILWWLAATSAVTFIATLVVVPWLIVRIPEDYFRDPKRHRVPWADRHAVVRVILLIGKNLLACLLLVAGIAMLLLPGQGILTILVGVLLLNFPGKYKLERWLIRRRPVLRSVNWLRRRSGRVPLET